MNSPMEFRPPYLRDADEGPHPIVDTPLWSENYLTQIYAPAAGIGFWFHLGRASFDPRLWNEVFIAYLPGDQYLVSTSFSYGETAEGPNGNQLHYRCKSPFRQWTKSFHGAAHLVSGAELRAGPFVPGESRRVDVELTWDSLGPAFDLGHLSSNESWSSSHYEQHATVRGDITYDGKRIELVGTGMRDHSWGPRDFSRFNTHVWMNGQFPDGSNFEIFHIVDLSGNVATHAVVGDGNGLHPAKLLSVPPLISDVAHVDRPYDIVLETDTGTRLDIHADIIQVPPMSIAGKSELLFGCHRPPVGSHTLLEAQTRYNWNGKIGYGLTDRTILLKNNTT